MIRFFKYLKNSTASAISIVVLVVLLVTISINLNSLKESHRQQSKFGTQTIFNEINNFVNSIEFSLQAALAAQSDSIISPVVANKLDENGIILIDKNSSVDNIFIAQQVVQYLPIKILQCINNELWVRSEITVNGRIFNYAYKFKHLQEYISNISNNKIIVYAPKAKFVTNCIQPTSIIKNPENFVLKRSVKIDGNQNVYDFIPAIELINTINKTIGYCYLAVDTTVVSKSLAIAQIQSLISLLLIILIVTISIRLKRNKKADSRRDKVLNDSNLSAVIDYQQVVNSATDVVRIIDLNYRIVFVNKSFTEITGIQKEDAVNKKCYHCFNSISCHTAECPLERILTGEKNVEKCEIKLNATGQKVEFIEYLNPLYNRDGEIVGIIERSKELTSSVEVEDKLKRTKQLFGIFVDNLPVGVFIEDGISQKITFQNDYTNQITGGQSIDNFIDGSIVSQKLGTRYHDVDEISIVDANNKSRYFKFHMFKYVDVDRQLMFGGLLIDVSKRKEVEVSRNILSKAIENSPICIVILSAQNTILYANSLSSKLLGGEPVNLIGKDIQNIEVEQNPKFYINTAIEEAKNGQIWQGEFSLKNRIGEQIWVNSSFIPIPDENGLVQNTVIIMSDITDRKEHEKEILIAKKQAEESDRLKSTFLSNLSHEIRTPLNAIIGFASLLSDDDLSSSERNNLSEIIYHNSNGLLHLIENIIEISEIETNQISILKKEFSINMLLNEVYQEVINEDQKKSNVKLNLKTPPKDIQILSDPSRIKQVINHLLNNACKFTEQGFIEFGYAVKDENTLLFYVVDSGVGIASDKQSLIFNPFRQADESNTRRFGGMGLGLAISKQIIEKIGGKIWISSMPNSGTSVYFTIPYITSSLKFEENDNNAIDDGYHWGSKTILVADDIDSNFTYFKSALKKTHAQLLWARNGSEAVNIVKNSPDIDLILMDLVMPQMDGFEATRTIKNFNNQIPIIGQTAYPTMQNRQKADESGFDSMLEKPIRVNKMLMEINKYINN